MTSTLIGIATLFAAGSILVAGAPTLGATSLDNKAAAESSHLRCGHGGGGGGGRRCGGGGRRCGGGGRRCASVPSCAVVPSCAARRCATSLK